MPAPPAAMSCPLCGGRKHACRFCARISDFFGASSVTRREAGEVTACVHTLYAREVPGAEETLVFQYLEMLLNRHREQKDKFLTWLRKEAATQPMCCLCDEPPLRGQMVCRAHSGWKMRLIARCREHFPLGYKDYDDIAIAIAPEWKRLRKERPHLHDTVLLDLCGPAIEQEARFIREHMPHVPVVVLEGIKETEQRVAEGALAPVHEVDDGDDETGPSDETLAVLAEEDDGDGSEMLVDEESDELINEELPSSATPQAKTRRRGRRPVSQSNPWRRFQIGNNAPLPPRRARKRKPAKHVEKTTPAHQHEQKVPKQIDQKQRKQPTTEKTSGKKSRGQVQRKPKPRRRTDDAFHVNGWEIRFEGERTRATTR